jgi:hypothetical protein
MIKSGVPQGSIHETLPFLFYVNNSPKIIIKPSRLVLFANNTSLIIANHISLEAFAATEINEIFSGRLPRQDVKVFRRFANSVPIFKVCWWCGRTSAKLMTRCPILSCVFIRMLYILLTCFNFGLSYLMDNLIIHSFIYDVLRCCLFTVLSFSHIYFFLVYEDLRFFMARILRILYNAFCITFTTNSISKWFVHPRMDLMNV